MTDRSSGSSSRRRRRRSGRSSTSAWRPTMRSGRLPMRPVEGEPITLQGPRRSMGTARRCPTRWSRSGRPMPEANAAAAASSDADARLPRLRPAGDSMRMAACEFETIRPGRVADGDGRAAGVAHQRLSLRARPAAPAATRASTSTAIPILEHDRSSRWCRPLAATRCWRRPIRSSRDDGCSTSVFRAAARRCSSMCERIR